MFCILANSNGLPGPTPVSLDVIGETPTRLMIPPDTAFFGFASQQPKHISLPELLEQYDRVVLAIGSTGFLEPSDLSKTVAHASFVYAYNSFKAISRLLPEFFHESASVVLRQLWEVSLNLHWLYLKPEERCREFCNYTIIEYRKNLLESNSEDEVNRFDEATRKFQSAFRFNNKRGRDNKNKRGQDKFRNGFSTLTIRKRCEEIGEPWPNDYSLLYRMTSMHSHGTPSAILRSIFVANETRSSKSEEISSALVAVIAVRTMVRKMRLLHNVEVIPDLSELEEAYQKFDNIVRNQL